MNKKLTKKIIIFLSFYLLSIIVFLLCVFLVGSDAYINDELISILVIIWAISHFIAIVFIAVFRYIRNLSLKFISRMEYIEKKDIAINKALIRSMAALFVQGIIGFILALTLIIFRFTILIQG